MARSKSLSARIMDAGLRDRLIALGWRRAGAVSCKLDGDGLVWKFVLKDKREFRNEFVDCTGAEIIGLDDISMEALGYRPSWSMLGSSHRVHYGNDLSGSYQRQSGAFQETGQGSQPSPLFYQPYTDGWSGKMTWTTEKLTYGEGAFSQAEAEECVAENLFRHWEELIWPRIKRARDIAGIVDEFGAWQSFFEEPELTRHPVSYDTIIALHMAGRSEIAQSLLQSKVDMSSKSFGWHMKRYWKGNSFGHMIQMWLQARKEGKESFMRGWHQNADMARSLASVLGLELRDPDSP